MRLRNRVIKSTFWTDPELLKWQREKRWFYLGLIQIADDSGCLEDSPFGFKILLFPSPVDSDITEEIISQWIEELILAKKLIPYIVDGRRYLYLANFRKYQILEHPSPPETPLPDWIEWKPSKSNRYVGSYELKEEVLREYLSQFYATVSNPLVNRYESVSKPLDNRYKTVSNPLDECYKTVSDPLVNRYESVSDPLQINIDKINIDKINLDKINIDKNNLDEINIDESNIDKSNLILQVNSTNSLELKAQLEKEIEDVENVEEGIENLPSLSLSDDKSSQKENLKVKEKPKKSSSNRKTKVKKFSPESKEFLDKFKSWREEILNIPVTQRDWHLKALSIIERLLKKYSLEELNEALRHLGEKERWENIRERIYEIWQFEDFLPRWKAEQEMEKKRGNGRDISGESDLEREKRKWLGKYYNDLKAREEGKYD